MEGSRNSANPGSPGFAGLREDLLTEPKSTIDSDSSKPLCWTECPLPGVHFQFLNVSNIFYPESSGHSPKYMHICNGK